MYTYMKGMLYCLYCKKETEHTIVYEGDMIKKIKCDECGTELEIDKEKAKKSYTEDFINRIFTKPQRMTEELQQDLTTFLLSLPIRIVTKPYRVLEEVKEQIDKIRRKDI